MANKIVLAWTVSTAGTALTPAQAGAKLAAVPLYANPRTDPVLGQLGLTVASDATATGSTSATRTLTLNMTPAAGTPYAPPPFPCRPVGPVPPPGPPRPVFDGAPQSPEPVPPPPPNPPPAPPYPIVDASTQRAIALTTQPTAGTYASADAVAPGQIVVELDVDLASPGTATYPSGTTIVVGQPSPGTADQFTPTPVDASVAALTKVFQATPAVAGQPVQATVSSPGGGGGTAAVTATVALAQPARLPALYSSSELDTDGVTLSPDSIPAGPGARTVSVSYLDSTGAGPFTVVTALRGKMPTPLALAGGSADVAVVTEVFVASTGGFGNSVGQVTLADLSAAPAGVNPTLPYAAQRDAAQLLVDRALVYLPPSYFAVAAQGAATPALAGDFLVTTGSPLVPTTADQMSALSAGDTLAFAAQPGVLYSVQSVTPKLLTLTTPYTGLDPNLVDANNAPRPTNQTARADKMPTAASRATPSAAAPPASGALATVLGEFVGTIGQLPTPTTVSGGYARTLSLALAAPVVSAPVTFL